MRIGILTNTYPPNLNGVSVAVKSLKKSLEKAGHKVFVATPEIKGQKYPSNILPIRSSPVPKTISPDLKLPYLYVNQTSEFFQKNGVEIVHTHDTIFGGLEGLIIAMKLNVPSVHTFHTMIENYDYFKIPGYKSLTKNFIQTVCNGYEHIIAPSPKVYDYLLSIGVYSRITQIFNVPDTEPLEKNTTSDFTEPKSFSKIFTPSADKKETYIDPATDFVFITFCRLAKEKGVGQGIEVLSPILKKYPTAKYLILGQGPEKENLENLVKNLKLDNKVIFTGKYERQELPYYASLSKVFLFTSTTENLPTNIFEAMFLGLPVISVDDSSVDYLLKDGENGFKAKLCDLTKIAEDLIQNPKKLIKLSQQAKESAKKLDPDIITKHHLALYRRNIQYFYEKKNRQKEIINMEVTNKLLEKPLKTLDKFSTKSLQVLRGKYQNFIQKYF